MPTEALKTKLKPLRAELRAANTLDSATRNQLSELADEIESILDESASDHESIRRRTEDAALRFEAEHPRFAGLLSEVTDALAKLGI